MAQHQWYVDATTAFNFEFLQYFLDKIHCVNISTSIETSLISYYQSFGNFELESNLGYCCG